MVEHDSSFLHFYQRELSHLETEMAQFSHAYPTSARKLGLGVDGSGDPHIRYLVEAVAFIAAKLRIEIERVPGEFAYNLVQALCPAVLQPLPAMSVVQFEPASDQLPAGSTVLPQPMRLVDSGGAHPVNLDVLRAPPLWPFSVETGWLGERHGEVRDELARETTSTFVIRVSAAREMAPHAPRQLSFFVGGPLGRALGGTEALLFGTRRVHVRAADGSWQRTLPPGSMLPGIVREHDREDEARRPLGERVLEGLAFPRQGCFVTLTNLARPRACRAFDILIEVEPGWRSALDAVREELHLNCAPVSNLYQRRAITLALEPGKTEYRFSESGLGGEPWEIHHISRVRLAGQGETLELPPWQPGLDSPVAGRTRGWSVTRVRHVVQENPNPTLVLRLIHDGPPGGYHAALVDACCVQRTAPARLASGMRLLAPNWDGPWRARLMVSPSPYQEPLFPSDRRLWEIVNALHWTASPDQAPAWRDELVRFLRIHERRGDPFLCRLIDSLRGVTRELVALTSLMAGGYPVLGMGAQYQLEFEPLNAGEGQLLLGRMISEILQQTSELNTPIEVSAKRGRQGRVRVS